jgi:hypothetical protein
MKRFTGHELHDQIGATIVLIDSVNRHDIGMIDTCRNTSFPQEPTSCLWAGSKAAGHKLDRDRTEEPGVKGFENRPHTASAQTPNDVVMRHPANDVMAWYRLKAQSQILNCGECIITWGKTMPFFFA